MPLLNVSPVGLAARSSTQNWVKRWPPMIVGSLTNGSGTKAEPRTLVAPVSVKSTLALIAQPGVPGSGIGSGVPSHCVRDRPSTRIAELFGSALVTLYVGVLPISGRPDPACAS